MKSDESWMREALNLALSAESQGEVPVGAVLVLDNSLIGSGHNSVISRSDPTAHAECMALRDAANSVGNYRLPNFTLYVTLEPCLMCVGAIVNARIARLVYGVDEPKTGAVKSNLNGLELSHLNHSVLVTSGVLEDECREIVQRFFKERRNSHGISQSV